VSTPQPVVIDLPEDHTGAVEIHIRHRGGTVATLQLALPNGDDGPSGGSAQRSAAAASGGRGLPDGRERDIVEAACDVMAAKGFAATSMRDIARAADVSIATMYRYIGSKDELLHRITAARMQELFDHFESSLSSGGTAGDRLAEAITVYVAYISKNHRYINLVYRETKVLGADARERIYETERRFMQFWEAIIEDGVRSGEFAVPDVNLAANLAYFACTVWALRHWSIGDRAEADVASMLRQLIVGGLTAR
jgi:AcrR family transcriptional regulator